MTWKPDLEQEHDANGGVKHILLEPATPHFPTSEISFFHQLFTPG